MFQGLDDYTLFDPFLFLVFVLNKNFGANWEFCKCSCVLVVVLLERFIFLCKDFLAFFCSNDPFLMEVVLVPVCRNTILKLAMEKDLGGT